MKYCGAKVVIYIISDIFNTISYILKFIIRLGFTYSVVEYFLKI
jgi:hypothetical protein